MIAIRILAVVASFACAAMYADRPMIAAIWFVAGVLNTVTLAITARSGY